MALNPIAEDAAIEPEDTDEVNPLRGFMLNLLVERKIPVESNKMGPKVVWETYCDENEFEGWEYGDKFKKLLLELREKAKLKKPKLDWSNSAAKTYLKKAFKDGLIATNYSDVGGPRQVWDDLCANHPAFRGMECGSEFTSHLRSVRIDFQRKCKRAEIDKDAFDNFRKNHPRPTHDHKGVPLWHGSKAEEYLKADIEADLHEGKLPQDLWESRPEYKVYDLKVFRDHIYQELRLEKLYNYLEFEASKKRKVLPEDDKETKRLKLAAAKHKAATTAKNRN